MVRRITLQAVDAAGAALLAAWRAPADLREVAPEAGDLLPWPGGDAEAGSAERVDSRPRPAEGRAPARRRGYGDRAPAGPVLALDTATEQAGVALVAADGRVLAARSWLSRRRHTVELAPTVAELLEEAGVAAAGLGAVAVTLGPGSYTGLRIALSLAKGIGLAGGCPVLGIPTLDLLAADPCLRAWAGSPGAAPAALGGCRAGAGSPRLWACLAAGRGRVLAQTYPWRPGAAGGEGEDPEPEEGPGPGGDPMGAALARLYPGGRRPADWPEPTAARAEPPDALAARLAPGDRVVGELDEVLLARLATDGIAALPLVRDPVVLARLARHRLGAAADAPGSLAAEAPLAPLYAA